MWDESAALLATKSVPDYGVSIMLPQLENLSKVTAVLREIRSERFVFAGSRKALDAHEGRVRAAKRVSQPFQGNLLELRAQVIRAFPPVMCTHSSV